MAAMSAKARACWCASAAGHLHLPNLFHLAALFGRFCAIIVAMNGRFEMASIGVFCAMVLDSLDGRVARMTIGAFGEQMDSLVRHGPSAPRPLVIAYVYWALQGHRALGLDRGLRLLCLRRAAARFNVNTTGVVDKRCFQGTAIARRRDW